MSKPISEQVVVILGASSGIGLLTAQQAARAGAKVVLAARNARDLELAVGEIQRDGGKALAVPTDAADYEQVQRLAERAIEEFGRIDTWINNAAVSQYGYFQELPLDDVRRVMEINFMGQVHGARAALPHLEHSKGTLICVGSALSDRGIPLQAVYCAAKHALKGLIDGLRVELRQRKSNVRITLVKPSSINTPLFNKAKTHLGVMPRPVPPVYEPELAAQALLHAAEHPVRDLYIGGAGKLFTVVERISPSLLDLQQLRSGFAGQKTEWSKSSDAPNNLYGAVEHDGGVRGDFTRETTNRSTYQRAQSGRRRLLRLSLALLSLITAAALVERGRTRHWPRTGGTRISARELKRGAIRRAKRTA